MPRVWTPLWYKSYIAVQGVWNLVWERILSHGRLSPAQTERAVAPERVLKIVVQSGLFQGGGGGISQI